MWCEVVHSICGASCLGDKFVCKKVLTHKMAFAEAGESEDCGAHAPVPGQRLEDDEK